MKNKGFKICRSFLDGDIYDCILGPCKNYDTDLDIMLPYFNLIRYVENNTQQILLRRLNPFDEIVKNIRVTI